ncbi:hypothetical protein HLH12_13765 [Acinetobacter sp. NIPH 2377]|uniref:hypothetical protein n=1 Tax=Acinetobacter terrestris TaxID=2529843 RepID=UPI0014905E85|nr:hypothetical protein [Acinetobacter terrestris]NNH36580.1 hypothetical protein [Acinetobacter terrestris]
MFSSKVCEFIKKMGMREIEYYNLISNQFSKNVTVFETMISFFMNKQNFKNSGFNDYVSNNKIDREADFFESLFEIFCCIELFISDGKLKLYKFRQPEWNVPRVVLNKSDFEFELLEDIKDIEFIYRGLSKDEFDSGAFGQSWTTDLSVAEDFASRDYNQPNGLVVKTLFNLEDVLHIAGLPEYEVIVENGAIKKNLLK